MSCKLSDETFSIAHVILLPLCVRCFLTIICAALGPQMSTNTSHAYHLLIKTQTTEGERCVRTREEDRSHGALAC